MAPELLNPNTARTMSTSDKYIADAVKIVYLLAITSAGGYIRTFLSRQSHPFARLYDALRELSGTLPVLITFRLPSSSIVREMRTSSTRASIAQPV